MILYIQIGARLFSKNGLLGGVLCVYFLLDQLCIRLSSSHNY